MWLIFLLHKTDTYEYIQVIFIEQNASINRRAFSMGSFFFFVDERDGEIIALFLDNTRFPDFTDWKIVTRE